MKNYIIFGFIFLLLWVLYSLNVQYGWVELQMDWTKVAIGVAAAGGPLQFLKQKASEKAAIKEDLETDFKFRTLKRDEFMQREKKAQRISASEKETTTASANTEDDFDTQEPSFG